MRQISGLSPWMQAAKPYWGSWIHGGGWLARHYWEYYCFTQDKDFLRKRAYPALKALAEFYADWLVLDESDGTLISYPETSPENSYIAADGKPAATSYGSAMAYQIITEVFDNTLASAQIFRYRRFVYQRDQSQKSTTSSWYPNRTGWPADGVGSAI